MAIDKRELGQALRQACHLRGDFRLRSGVISKEYFDKYRFESDPNLLHDVALGLAELIPRDVEALAGLELGGIPIATALSQITRLPALFVRKTAKEYGTCHLVEGSAVEGRKILVVEDVVTSGGQVVKSTLDLRKLGANVVHALCVIDREAGGREALAVAGLELKALFRTSELLSYITGDSTDLYRDTGEVTCEPT